MFSRKPRFRIFNGGLRAFCALKKSIDKNGCVEVLYELPKGLALYDEEYDVWYANKSWIKNNFDRAEGDVEFLRSMGIKP